MTSRRGEGKGELVPLMVSSPTSTPTSPMSPEQEEVQAMVAQMLREAAANSRNTRTNSSRSRSNTTTGSSSSSASKLPFSTSWQPAVLESLLIERHPEWKSRLEKEKCGFDYISNDKFGPDDKPLRFRLLPKSPTTSLPPLQCYNTADIYQYLLDQNRDMVSADHKFTPSTLDAITRLYREEANQPDAAALVFAPIKSNTRTPEEVAEDEAMAQRLQEEQYQDFAPSSSSTSTHPETPWWFSLVLPSLSSTPRPQRRDLPPTMRLSVRGPPRPRGWGSGPTTLSRPWGAQPLLDPLPLPAGGIPYSQGRASSLMNARRQREEEDIQRALQLSIRNR